MTHVDSERAWSPAVRTAVRVAASTLVAFVAGFIVWFVGFDALWAIAVVLAVGPVVALLASRKLEGDAEWDAPRREIPRTTRLTVTAIEQSLAACNRLARPLVIRRLQALLFPERDDQLAQQTVLRRIRALLAAELREDQEILPPHDEHSISTAAIARCLDAVERLGTTANAHHETSR